MFTEVDFTKLLPIMTAQEKSQIWKGKHTEVPAMFQTEDRKNCNHRPHQFIPVLLMLILLKSSFFPLDLEIFTQVSFTSLKLT